jgi:hypothetical protein
VPVLRLQSEPKKERAPEADRRAAAIAALRAASSIPAPEAQAPVVAPETPTQAAPVAPAAPDYAAMFAQYDAKAQAAAAEYQKAEASKAEAMRLRAEAEGKQKELADSLNDPLSFIEKAGMTADEWQAFLLNGGKRDPVQEALKDLKKQNQELVAKMEARDKAEQDARAQAQRAQSRAVALQEVDKGIDWKSAPLAKRLGVTAELVLSQVEAHHQKTGQVLDPRVLVANYEKAYREQFQGVLQDSEIQSIFNTTATAPSKPTDTSAAPSTLNSRVTSSTGPAQPNRRLSFEEKRAIAVQELRRINGR